uniref:RNA-directed DNA polymerase n=1 Tax=Candidatus Kentrum sp. LFY TaxID=2126342 RepID=A0A450UF05_9GAMM|nr:MAG: Reverse transcriptase (RNA-dependent DNA polymerase) [Candidatus Kentron sp. LFY]
MARDPVAPFIVDFRKAKDTNHLATLIGCHAEMLDRIRNSATHQEFYREHRIPKRNRRRRGEYRVVWQAVSELAQIQKALLRKFENFARDTVDDYPHSAVHGYVTGRSTLTNARCHAGAKIIARADIKDFFPSISRARLEALLTELGIYQSVAEVIGGLATIDDGLGQGIHTSPFFANLVCIPLDQELSDLAGKYQAIYTRYADDLTFSSDTRVPDRIAIETVLQTHGFQLAKDKFRTTKIGQAHFVTGLSVSEPDRPRIPYKFKHKLRQELYYSDRFGILDHAKKAGYGSIGHCVNGIDGRISYLQGIEPELGVEMRQLWKSLLKRDGLFSTYLPTYKEGMRQIFKEVEGVSYFIDETETHFRGDVYLGLALVAVATGDVSTIEEAIAQTLDRFLHDPYASGRKEKLQKKGLHFTDDSEEIRTDFIKTIARFPIRAFIAYRKLSGITRKDAYLSLLRILVTDRLSDPLLTLNSTIIYEQLSEVPHKYFELTIHEVMGKIKERGGKFYQEPRIVCCGKRDQPCIAIADYLLGVFSHYATSEPPNETPRKRFERLRDKIRLIVDADEKRRFWRNNPFPGFSAMDGTENNLA